MLYRKELRQRVIEDIRLHGESVDLTAKKFRVGKSTIYGWLKKEDPYAIAKPGRTCSYKFKEEDLIAQLDKNPNILQRELAIKFGVVVTTICVAMKRLGYTRKKNKQFTNKA
jgi:transposase